MTPEHFLFIPTVFFLGFFFGGLFSQKFSTGQSQDSLHSDDMKSISTKTSGYALGLSFFIFMIVFITTHILPFFGGSKAINLVTNGKPLFDQKPVFSSSEFYQRLNEFGNIGREMYLRFTYTVDIIFPLAFLGFLFVLIKFVLERKNISKDLGKKIMILPIFWFITDMFENSFLFYLIFQFPNTNEFLSSIVGYVTLLKFTLLILSIVTPVIISVFIRNTKVTWK